MIVALGMFALVAWAGSGISPGELPPALWLASPCLGVFFVAFACRRQPASVDTAYGASLGLGLVQWAVAQSLAGPHGQDAQEGLGLGLIMVFEPVLGWVGVGLAAWIVSWVVRDGTSNSPVDPFAASGPSAGPPVTGEHGPRDGGHPEPEAVSTTGRLPRPELDSSRATMSQVRGGPVAVATATGAIGLVAAFLLVFWFALQRPVPQPTMADRVGLDAFGMAAAASVWRVQGGAEFVGRSGVRYTQLAEWHDYGLGGLAACAQNDDCTYSGTVEGRLQLVEHGTTRDYIGEAQYHYRRALGGPWKLRQIVLSRSGLVAEVDVDVAAALAEHRREGFIALDGPLSDDTATGALQKWLRTSGTFGSGGVIREPGGTFTITAPHQWTGWSDPAERSPWWRGLPPGDTEVWGVLFEDVPYHDMSRRHGSFSGQASAEFRALDGGWVLARVFTSDLLRLPR